MECFLKTHGVDGDSWTSVWVCGRFKTEDLLRFSGAGRSARSIVSCSVLHWPFTIHPHWVYLAACVIFAAHLRSMSGYVQAQMSYMYGMCAYVCVCTDVWCAAVFFAHSSAVKRGCVLLLLSCCCRNTSVPKLLPCYLISSSLLPLWHKNMNPFCLTWHTHPSPTTPGTADIWR